MDSFYEQLHRIAFGILRDAHGAEEATQQSMLLLVWHNLPRLREPDRLEAWASRVLVHECRTQWRRTRRWWPSLMLSGAESLAPDGFAWQGSGSGFSSGSGDNEVWAPGIVVLVGEGAYEGLFAVFDDSDWGDIRGVIFPAGPPPAPVAP